MFSTKYPALLALIVCFCVAANAGSSFAYNRGEAEYTVQGKKVEKNVYKAALLINESIPLIKASAYDRAVGKLKHAVLIAPEFSQSYIYLGICYARQNRMADAVVQLQKAIKCKDAPAHAYETLATLYQTNGNLDGALDTLKSLQQKFGSEADERTNKIVAMLQYEKVRRQYSPGAYKSANNQDDYLQDALNSGFHKWSSFRMPLKVYIEPGDDVEGHTPHYDDILRQSFYDWAKALDRKVSFMFVDQPEKADIKCHWTNDPSELGAGIEDGETKIRFIGETLVSATIALRAKEAEGRFPFSENLVLTTCRHEAGHALGLSGHSPDPKDVMFYSIPIADVERKISLRDKNTMLKIYTKQQSPQYVVIDFLVNPVNSAFVGLAIFFLVLIGIIVPRLSKRKKKKRP